MKDNRKNRKWKYITEKNFLRFKGCKVASWETLSNNGDYNLDNVSLIKDSFTSSLNNKIQNKMIKFKFSRFIELSKLEINVTQTSEDFINDTSTILASIKIKFIK